MKVALPVSFERQIIGTTVTGEAISVSGPMRLNYPVDSDYVNPDNDSLFFAMLDSSVEHLYDRLLNGRELSSLSVKICNVAVNFQAIEKKAHALPDFADKEKEEWFGGHSSRQEFSFKFDVKGIAENNEPVESAGKIKPEIMFNSPEDAPDHKEILREAISSAFQCFWSSALDGKGPCDLLVVTVSIRDLKLVKRRAKRS